MFRGINWDGVALLAVVVALMAPLGLYGVARVHAIISEHREAQAMQSVMEQGASLRRIDRPGERERCYQVSFDGSALASMSADEASILASHLRKLRKVHLNLSGASIGQKALVRLLEEAEIQEIDVRTDPLCQNDYDELKIRFPRTKINVEAFRGCILMPRPPPSGL